MSIQDDIKRDYPELYWLFSDPEVGHLLRDAVNPSVGFDQTTFRAKLQGTHWFRSRSEAQRNWDILSHTDPGTANRRRADYRARLSQQMKRLGIIATTAELNFMAELGLQRGQSPDDPEVINGLLAFGRKPGNLGPGAIQTAAYDVKAEAEANWFYNQTRNNAHRWGELIASGKQTMEDFKTQMQLSAMHRYSHLAERIKGGETLADIANPLRQVVAEELELGSPNAINMDTATWSKLLTYHDPTTKHTRAMTTAEARVLARQQPTWWTTTGGKQADSEMASKLLNIFGMRKSA